MARLATLAVLLLSLLAVASCRVLQAGSVISDDQGPPNPADLTEEADAAEVVLSSLPAPAVAEDKSVLWFPFHHCPCHRSHLWLARHHGLSHSHRGALSGPGEARVHPASVPIPTHTELEHGEEYAHTEPELELEAVAVAEPDPDGGEKKSFHAKQMSVKEWKAQTARFFGHHEHEEDKDDDHEQDKGEGTNMKLFGRFHHRYHLLHHRHEQNENEQHKDEGMIMKLLRRCFHRHAHGDDGEANKQAEPESGYSSFFKALMNRF